MFKRSFSILLGVLLLTTALLPATAVAKGSLSPGEALSPAAIEAALASMDPVERAGREAAFRDPTRPIVAYIREVFPVTAVNRTGRPNGGISSLAHVGDTNLVLSVSVAWETACPVQLTVCWLVTSYFNWDNVDLDLSGQEKIGTAWANNMAIGGRAAVGYYQNGSFITFSNRDDVPNTGTGIGFNEWKPLTKGNTYADYGWDYVTIGSAGRQYQATNVVFKYFHTYQSLIYALTFSSSPSITISPTTSTWSKSAVVTFTN